MNLARYEAFLKTVELRSLTRAASALGYTQSGVTHMLNALEAELGMQLLQRGKGGVSLTGTGQELLPHIQAVCDRERLLQNRAAELRGLKAGTLRVGTFNSVSVHWAPGILRSFMGEYPNIRVELWNMHDPEREAMLAQGRIDCAFMELPARADFEAEWLARDPIYAIMPKGHPLAGQTAVAKADLARYPFIWQMDGSGQESWSHRFAPKKQPELSTADDYAIMAMVEHGLGVSLLPELVMQNSGRSIEKRELAPAAYRDLGIAVLPSQAPLAAREFIRHARAYIASGPCRGLAGGPAGGR